MEMCTGHIEERLIQNPSRLDHLQFGQGGRRTRRGGEGACVEEILTMVRVRLKPRAVRAEKISV